MNCGVATDQDTLISQPGTPNRFVGTLSLFLCLSNQFPIMFNTRQLHPESEDFTLRIFSLLFCFLVLFF